MNKKERFTFLQEQAEKKFEYLEELESRGLLKTNKQARLRYAEEKEKLAKIVDELGELEKQLKIDERGNQDMKKIETRSMDNFEVELRNLATTANATALIPENVQSEIVKRMEEVSPAFAQARKLPSVSGSLKVAMENDSVAGGFFGEGEAMLEQAISFNHVELKQKRIGAALSLSDQLINDTAVDIVTYVKDLLGRRVGKTAEQAIFNGDGVKEFSGIVTAAGVEEIEMEDGFESIYGLENLMNIYTSLHPDFLDGAAFYVNRASFAKIAKLKDANGHFYLQNGVVNGKPTYTLFGAPVYVTEALADDVTAGNVPVVFGNLNEAYSIMVKQEMGIKQIVDGQNALRGSQLLVLDGYMDGAVVNHQAIVRGKVVNLVA